MRHEEGTFEAEDGLRLYRQSWRPDTELFAHVLLLHGLADHSGRYAHVAQVLTAHGFAVHTFDLRGHGRSGGRRAYFERFEHLLADVDRFCVLLAPEMAEQPVILFGHSMGGLIAVRYVLTRQPKLCGAVLTGPALAPGDDISPLVIRVVGVLGTLLPHLPLTKLDSKAVSRDAAVVQAYQQDPLVYHAGIPARTGAELLRALRTTQGQMAQFELPVFILHGDADRLTNPDGSRQLYAQARSADKTLKRYPGLYHEVMNEPEREEVLHDITTWLSERLGRCT